MLSVFLLFISSVLDNSWLTVLEQLVICWISCIICQFSVSRCLCLDSRMLLHLKFLVLTTWKLPGRFLLLSCLNGVNNLSDELSRGELV